MSNSKCSVCNDPPVCNDKEKNPILKCKKCDLQAHVLCYGIEDDENFVCSPCVSEAGVVHCAICNKRGGALKQTTDDRWAHVLCTFFTEDSEFTDKISMEPIDITKVKQPKTQKPCVFCNESFGTFKCSKCNKFLHAPCGLENDCLVEFLKPDGNIQFSGFCSKHVPSKKKKRISSEGLNGAIKVMTKKQKNIKSRKENYDWVHKKLMNSETNTASESSAVVAAKSCDLPSSTLSHDSDISQHFDTGICDDKKSNFDPEETLSEDSNNSHNPDITANLQKKTDDTTQKIDASFKAGDINECHKNKVSILNTLFTTDQIVCFFS